MPEPRRVDLSYRAGWIIQHVAGPGGWIRTAVRGDRQVEQGARSYAQLLDALDRIDGRPVLRDFIDGLEMGLSKEEASRPVPVDEQGNPIRGDAPLQLEPLQAQPQAVPLQLAAASVGFDPGVQTSLFDLF